MSDEPIKTVYKYVIPTPGIPTAITALDGPVVHAEIADDLEQATLWIEGVPGVEVSRSFAVFSTGHSIPNHYESWKHRHTHVGPIFVWHLYEWSTDD